MYGQLGKPLFNLGTPMNIYQANKLTKCKPIWRINPNTVNKLGEMEAPYLEQMWPMSPYRTVGSKSNFLNNKAYYEILICNPFFVTGRSTYSKEIFVSIWDDLGEGYPRKSVCTLKALTEVKKLLEQKR